MKSKFILSLLLLSLVGCAGKGDKPLARGQGLGYDWSSPAAQAVLRISVQNSFTRDAVVAVDGEGKHYEILVGPIRDAFIVISKGDYDYSGWSYGKDLGNTRLKLSKEERNGIAGVLIQIRP